MPSPAATLAFAQKLARHVRGDVLFDAASRSQFRIDHPQTKRASFPIAVLAPFSETDAYMALEVARDCGIQVVQGHSNPMQLGFTLRDYVLINTAPYLNHVLHIDTVRQSAVVQAGVTTQQLNDAIKTHRLSLPQSPQSPQLSMPLGDWAMQHHNVAPNVLGLDVVLADGQEAYLGGFGLTAPPIQNAKVRQLVSRLFELASQHEPAIRNARNGAHTMAYNLDVFYPQQRGRYTADDSVNLAHVLVGSQGTLAYIKRLHLRLALLEHEQTSPLAPTDDNTAGHITPLDPVCTQFKHAFDAKQLFS